MLTLHARREDRRLGGRRGRREPEGSEVELPRSEFGLIVGEPAAFRFFGSWARRKDRPGDVVESGEAGQFEELAPLETTLVADGQDGRTVPVRLRPHVTERARSSCGA